MFYIVAVQGCEPYVDVMLDNGEEEIAASFETKVEAEAYAEENCAWEWRIVEF